MKKGSGPDDIPPIFYKMCSSTLTFPLTILFNLSLQTGKFPSLSKEAYVTPLHKSGNRSNVANYRPVSLISTVSKIFESIVTDVFYI